MSVALSVVMRIRRRSSETASISSANVERFAAEAEMLLLSDLQDACNPLGGTALLLKRPAVTSA